MVKKSPLERIMNGKYTIDPVSGCWNWSCYIRADGYGGLDGELAHRICYEALRGEIPRKLEIDHLCRNRRCINPAHLEPVTRRVNALRGISPAAKNAKKLYCAHGHPFGGDNLKVDGRGRRQCRACIERGITKAACLAMVEKAGIALPPMYAMGFQNNNCIPCVKATSPSYWALVRKQFPEKFERMSRLARELDVRLCRIDGERRFIDEIPASHSTTDPIQPSCDFLCQLAEQDLPAPRHQGAMA